MSVYIVTNTAHYDNMPHAIIDEVFTSMGKAEEYVTNMSEKDGGVPVELAIIVCRVKE